MFSVFLAPFVATKRNDLVILKIIYLQYTKKRNIIVQYVNINHLQKMHLRFTSNLFIKLKKVTEGIHVNNVIS